MRTGDPEEATSEALSQQLAENFNNGDFSALAAMLAEDIALFPPGLQGLHGRDAVRAYWRQARRVRAVQFAAASIKPLGDGCIREIGMLLLTLGPGRQGRGGE